MRHRHQLCSHAPQLTSLPLQMCQGPTNPTGDKIAMITGLLVFLLGVTSYVLYPAAETCTTSVTGNNGVSKTECVAGDSNINGVGTALFVGIFGILGGKKGNKSFIITFLVFAILSIIVDILMSLGLGLVTTVCVAATDAGTQSKESQDTCDTIGMLTVVTMLKVVVDLVAAIGASMSVCCGKEEEAAVAAAVAVAAPVAAVAVAAAP